MNKFKWDYSNYSDILHVQKKDKSTKGSVEFGDFTLDFGEKDEVVGVEIEHASEFFKNMDISKENLNEIKYAQFIMDNRNPQYQLIFLELKLPTFIKKIPLPLPITS